MFRDARERDFSNLPAPAAQKVQVERRISRSTKARQAERKRSEEKKEATPSGSRRVSIKESRRLSSAAKLPEIAPRKKPPHKEVTEVQEFEAIRLEKEPLAEVDTTSLVLEESYYEEAEPPQEKESVPIEKSVETPIILA